MQVWDAYGSKDSYLRAPRRESARVRLILMARNMVENAQQDEAEEQRKRAERETERQRMMGR